MTDRKIGVFVCYCGGNISDYVDVEKVREAVSNDRGVVVAKTTMFACSDAAQEEIINDIKTHKLNGIVVASCSPKLHLFTFRAMSERAGLNPYQYVQVNLREQDSWVHQHDMDLATDKGIRLVRAGIAKCALTEPLSTMRIKTIPKVLVIGAGAAGLRAAVSLSDMGFAVFIVEKEPAVGGWTKDFGKMYPNNHRGNDLIGILQNEIKQRENITVFTNAELTEKSGNVGDLTVKIRVHETDSIALNVGTIIVATGFDAYQPSQNEFGYGQNGVVTLPEFKQLLDNSNGSLRYNEHEINNIVYIYCVGSRQAGAGENLNPYCSRYCCTAAVHSAVCVNDLDADINQYHLFRDMRTYGKQEIIYNQAGKQGSVFIRYSSSAARR